jgi:HEAT repeat protein
MVNDKPLLEPVMDKLADSDEKVRHSAVRDLLDLHVPEAVPLLLNTLGDDSLRIRQAALDIICLFPSQVIFPRLEELVKNEESANSRNAAIEAFVRYGKHSVPYLIQMLADPDERVRMYGALILSQIKDPRAVDTLLDTIGDPSINVKHNVIEALGKIGDARAVQPIISCLTEGFWIQYPAVVALGDLGDARACESLMRLLEQEMLTQVVIQSLGKIGELSNIPVLFNILASGSDSITDDVIAALVDTLRRSSKEYESPKEKEACRTAIKAEMDKTNLAEYLIASLHDENKTKVRNTMVLLGCVEEKKAIVPLLKYVDDYELEIEAAEALADIGRRHPDDLSVQLQSPDPTIRAAVIRCLGLVGDLNAIRACIPYLDDEDNNVRQQAIIALAARTSEEDIVSVLVNAISNEDPEVRSIAVSALVQGKAKGLVEKLLPKLVNGTRSEMIEAMNVLGRRGDDSASKYVEAHLENDDDELRDAAYKALYRIRPEKVARSILETGLSDGNPDVRKATARCLVSRQSGIGESALQKLLNDGNPGVCIVAIESLGNLRSSASTTDLITIFEKADIRKKLAIVKALGDIQGGQALDFLRLRLSDPIADLRIAILEALGKFNDLQLVPDLVRYLEDPEWPVRIAAITSLDKLRAREAISTLIQCLDDEEEIVQAEAIVALGNMGDNKAVSHILPLLATEGLLPKAIEALEKLGIPDIQQFEEFLTKANTQLKCLLMDLLGRLDDPKAADCLIRSLEQDFYSVRVHAARALGNVGSPDSIPPLERAKMEDQDEDVKKEADEALKKIDH